MLRFTRHDNDTVCLALEVNENHTYGKSRCLRGAVLDEAKIERGPAAANTAAVRETGDDLPLRWLRTECVDFELLDTPIVFDNAQETVRRLALPVAVLGLAGSDKTAATLSRLQWPSRASALRSWSAVMTAVVPAAS